MLKFATGIAVVREFHDSLRDSQPKRIGVIRLNKRNENEGVRLYAPLIFSIF